MKRALALVLLVGCLAACGTDPSTVAGPSSPTTAAPGAGGATPDGGRPREEARVTRSPSTPLPAQAAPCCASGTTAPATPAPAVGAPGAWAAYFLRASQSRALTLQILATPGADPHQATVDHLTSVLRTVSAKAVTVTRTTFGADSGGWTSASIASAASSYAPSPRSGVAVVQLLFVRGGYQGDDSVLGLSVNSSVAAIFPDRISSAATGLATPARIEESVTTHELGHLLGLVDLYLHTGRSDPQHPGHSTNPRSVMYWAVESDVVGDLLTGGPPTDFDQTDLADLSTIRRG